MRSAHILGFLCLGPSVALASYSFDDEFADLGISLHSRAENVDGSLPVYKDPTADIEARVEDLLPRMTIKEKVSQLIQGDMNGWMNFSDPLDNTLVHNETGVAEMLDAKGGMIWVGYQTPYDKFVYGVEIGQRYLMENTTLGIPALVQSEGLHGFTNNGTIFPSPIGLAATFNTSLISAIAKVIADESEPLGINHIFAPVLDLARELRWGRVEEGFGEDPFLTGELGAAFVEGLQSGRRQNASDTAVARVAATCKHFAAFGSPQGGLNIAPVTGGERELRTMYLRPFKRACLDALSFMTAYSSYDGVPTAADPHILIEILREEWGYPYFVVSDAGSVDLQITTHGTCEDRACAARNVLVDGRSGEMGGGTYTFFTLEDQVKNGTVAESDLDEVVRTLLRTKFALGLFENPYPYKDYTSQIRTEETLEVLHQADLESIVLLENRNDVLPLDAGSLGSIALIGPQAGRVSMGDYVFLNASDNGITPVDGFKQYLEGVGSQTIVNYAEGCKLWSNDESGFDEAVAAAEASDVAIVMVGTWTLDQTNLWTPGTNATTGEHVDISSLALVGAQLRLAQAIHATGVPTIVVLVSGKPVAEPWIQAEPAAVLQQFYPGELGGLALAEIIFGEYSPSGKLPVSYPRSVGTAPAFYNYLKGARPIDAGSVLEDGTLMFGHQYVLDSPVPLWSFGHGLSYTTFNYTDLVVPSTIGTADDFEVEVTMHNTGTRDAAETVQVYMTDVFSSVMTPNQELVGFAKVFLPAGSSRTITIPVHNDQLAVWSARGTWVVEPGAFTIKIGTSEEAYLSTTLTVVA
ncbi:glycoside hydrolase family 3 protein [Schizophyllum commune H4-8]|uniref:Glycoside hydrolase family 3 protein n=1 Tax=Schizophyllum commune (strain H4-8 / FGSC 9210) TaxID=578458 RepID=D8Q418_SCHCM|nr:glycoside hydrolase family 3 protein [Schizophyllum commune H4-8]KAI5892796.1 glycoside hydrolase family 3 protein [Schizophyllum commune H4-8]